MVTSVFAQLFKNLPKIMKNLIFGAIFSLEGHARPIFCGGGGHGVGRAVQAILQHDEVAWSGRYHCCRGQQQEQRKQRSVMI